MPKHLEHINLMAAGIEIEPKKTNDLLKLIEASDFHLFETLSVRIRLFDFNQESCVSLKLKNNKCYMKFMIWHPSS